MKRIIILLILCAPIGEARAQQMHLTKTTVIGGNRGIYIKEMRSTPDGGVFWTGYTNDSSGIGDFSLCSPQNAKLKTVAGKIDSNGNKEWVRIYCDWNAQPSTGCNNDGYAIGGLKHDTSDIFLTKLDCDGKVQWQHRWGSSKDDGTGKVIRLKDKGYLVLASTYGDDGDIPFSYQPPGSTFNYSDIVLIKTDSLGNKQWLKVFGSTTEDVGVSIYEIGSHYYMIAYHDNLVQDHDFSDTSYPGYNWCYLLKIDTLGNLIWNKSVGSISANDVMYDSVDSTFVTVSAVSDAPPFNNHSGKSNYGVAKINLDGQIVWVKHYGDANYIDIATGICKGPNNSYLILGETQSETFNALPPRLGRLDGLIYWIDSAGNEITHKFFGTIDYEVPEKIAGLRNTGRVLASTRGIAVNNPFTEGIWLYGNGVTVGATFSVLDLWATSIEQSSISEERVKAYPNPVRDLISIELPKESKPVTARVYTIDGKIMGVYNIQKRNTSIDTKDWASGIYIISFTGENGYIGSVKVQVQH